MLFGQEAIESANKAVAAFNAANKDPKAQLLYTHMNATGQLMAFLQVFYDAPKPPKGTFDGLRAVPVLQGQLSSQSFTTLLDSFDVDSPFKSGA